MVTGGAGFIGSAVIRHIIGNTTDTVINVDKLTYAGNLESLTDVENSERYHFRKIDICDGAALDAAFAEFSPDAVMHLAAESPGLLFQFLLSGCRQRQLRCEPSSVDYLL